jgi:hypothetical protein
MAKSLQELLANADDSELCNGVFDLIITHHGEDIDASTIGMAERVVLLAWHASGIIGNGGFRYLFEGNITGDPYFALTPDAFQAAGCKKAAEAIQKTLALFPRSRPQRDIKERLRHYLGRIKAWPTDMDMQFFAADRELRKCLADYIRSHEFAFRHLDRPKTKRAPERPAPVEKAARAKTEGPFSAGRPAALGASRLCGSLRASRPPSVRPALARRSGKTFSRRPARHRDGGAIGGGRMPGRRPRRGSHECDDGCRRGLGCRVGIRPKRAAAGESLFGDHCSFCREGGRVCGKCCKCRSS